MQNQLIDLDRNWLERGADLCQGLNAVEPCTLKFAATMAKELSDWHLRRQAGPK